MKPGFHSSGIAGFITAIPIYWTKDESIRIKYPTAIIVRNDKEKNVIDSDGKDMLVADADMKYHKMESNG